MPGETVRALVSLWILFHFLGVVLALGTDNSLISTRSELLGRMKRAPFLNQYIYALWLDVGHDYRFVTEQPNSERQMVGDYLVDADLVYSDGHTVNMPLIPEDAHGERRERYLALSRITANGVESESPDTSIENAVGGSLLNQLKEDGVKEVLFHVRHHIPLSMADAAASDPGQRNPNNARTKLPVLTVSVTLNSNNEPQVQVKAQSARDVAPVTNPGTLRPGRSQPPGPTYSPNPSQ
jgi:hypothetical protein